MILLFIFCAMAEWTALAQDCYRTDDAQFPATGSQAPGLSVVALGTSLVWGNGLNNQDTFRYLVAGWLAKSTGRAVHLSTFAHSAALLTPGSGPHEMSPDPQDGALNGFYPTVEDELNCAASGAFSLGKADLILLDGCINDVSPYGVVAPWTETSKIEGDSDHYCGEVMATVLEETMQKFPSAIVVVTGYFPIVSLESKFGISGAGSLAKLAYKISDASTVHISHPQAFPDTSNDEILRKMAANSEAFYQHSKSGLKMAVQKANSGGSTRAFFAGLPEVTTVTPPTVDPAFAYGAPQTHLWLIPFHFLWWTFNKDEDYSHRMKTCKHLLFPDNVMCETNAGFHPRPAGEQIYFNSIQSVIPDSVVQAWKTPSP